MNCLYCKNDFTPHYNHTTKENTKYCSSSCVAKMNRDKLIRLPLLRDPDWLFEQYWTKKRSMKDISVELGCAESRVYVLMDRLGISRRTIAQSLVGRKLSIKHKMNLAEASKGRWRGKNNPNWKGGIVSHSITTRNNADYLHWRRQILRKYQNVCQGCNKKIGKTCGCCEQKIQGIAHHILSVEKYPELVVDINNGILLCYKCHQEKHKLTPE